MSTHNTPHSLRRVVKVTAAAALASIVGGLGCYEVRSTLLTSRQTEAHDVASPAAMKFDYRPTLLVIRDSYAVTYPDLVAERMDWNLVLDGQDGTGFAPGDNTHDPAHLPFIDRLNADVATYRVDYVLIDGGRNDLGQPPELVAVAADEYIRKVRSAWSNAKIVVLLPAADTPAESANYAAVADGLRQTAESVGAYVIDPVAQGWYRGIDGMPPPWQDGLHVAGDADETFRADKIIENLTLIGSGS